MRSSFRFSFPATMAILFGVAPAAAATLQVGPGKAYAMPCQAIAAAAPGDTIEVDSAGNYDGDVCGWTKNGLTIRGVGGGRAKIDAAGQNAQGKAIWVIAGDDTTIEHIELSGATVVDMNGAGIRQEGTNLTIRDCYFHDNEDGILAGDDPNSEILIERTEFANNGFGDGFSHNLYINHVKKLTFRYNYSHHAKIGHLLKSRAAENHVLYNRITGESGTSSYEIDLPNGGLSYIIGNLIEQGPNTDNSGIVSYQAEGAHPSNPSHELFVVNNTFVNNRPNGGNFIQVGGSVTTPVVIRNNIFMGPGNVTTQATAVQEANFAGDPQFVNGAGYDYHLQAGSPCADMGVAPGMGAGMALDPVFQYVHPAGTEGRITVGVIDVGAYELGGGTGGSGGSSASSSGAGGSASGTGGNGSGATGGGTTGAGGNPTTTGSVMSGAGGSGGAGGDGNGDSGDQGGCGCRLGAEDTGGRAIVVIFVAGLLSARRRTRRRVSLL